MRLNDLITRYVAVWNESDADERRNRVRSVWAIEGATCYRLVDARGYDAIEDRVTGSWEKWLREGKYIFRPKKAICHHDAVKFDFEMVSLPDGKVEASGLTFLILDSDGRIRYDFQFNPTATEAEEFVERYLGVFNAPNADARRSRVTDVWAFDGAYITETSVTNGHSGIEAKASEVHDASCGRGFSFLSANSSHAHHNVVKFKWKLQSKGDGKVAIAGSDLVILDESGRIRFDYQYPEPV